MAFSRTAVVTITSGLRLGHYEIRSQLGAGGMGQYLAHYALCSATGKEYLEKEYLLMSSPSNEQTQQLSPDGHWLNWTAAVRK